MGQPFRIGVDGGGTKTECILTDEAGEVVAHHLAPGCNPNIVGPETARRILTDALRALLSRLPTFNPQPSTLNSAAPTLDSQLSALISPSPILTTHLYMSGSRPFWRETAAELREFGRVIAADDSLPVLELATRGAPGLVLHGGTGSFVAARAPDGTEHYAGGLGWRLGDPGSGYDLGRRALAHALLEMQGWAPGSRLGPAVREPARLGESGDAGALMRFFYHHAEPNGAIAALAPAVLGLAADGDAAARELVRESAAALLALARRVATKLFPRTPLSDVPAGLSGPILTHPAMRSALASNSPMRFNPVEGTPIDGVRRLVMRAAARGPTAP